jgi:hypothetical protein
MRSWKKNGDYGWICEPYRIGLYFVDGRSLYQAWYHDELIATKDEFSDAMAACRQHDAEMVAGQA